jgi:hypothetical protein
VFRAQHKPIEWKKYYQGGWTEPALAPGTAGGCQDGCNASGGRFTPLNLPPQGYMHGDAAYNAALKQWCIVVMSGGRIQETDQWRCVVIDCGPRQQSRVCLRENKIVGFTETDSRQQSEKHSLIFIRFYRFSVLNQEIDSGRVLVRRAPLVRLADSLPRQSLLSGLSYPHGAGRG